MSYETATPAAIAAEAIFAAAQNGATNASESATKGKTATADKKDAAGGGRGTPAAHQVEKSSTLPKWQQITGITANNEGTLSQDERDAGIRALVKEVERLARIEFKRQVPAGERTCFWDPLARVCMILQISRSKLSALSRELTGMRAHEITDRIQAENLPTLLMPRLRAMIVPEVEALQKSAGVRLDDRHLAAMLAERMAKKLRERRNGIRAAGWAAGLGYANVSRLNRACLLSFGVSLTEFEWQLISQLVQKFILGLAAELKTSGTPAASPYKEDGGDDFNAQAHKINDTQRTAPPGTAAKGR